MCHHRGRKRPWFEDIEETASEEPAADTAADELPSFLNEEASGETDLLTDGGDSGDDDTGSASDTDGSA